ncbi:MAG: cyclic nucleotide-binding domain-containing protein [Deltaproteobacteria bacterium]
MLTYSKKLLSVFLMPTILLLTSIALLKYRLPLLNSHVESIYLTGALQCAVWFFSAALTGRFINYTWNRILIGSGRPALPGVAQYITSSIIYLIAFCGIWSSVFHRPISGILAASGFLGLVLGFALRTLIMDFFMGLAVNFDQPYNIGDFIMLNKEKLDGQVIDISWRTTRLKTNENNIVVIPNNIMGSVVLTNFSRPSDDAEMEILFHFDFSVPVRDVKRIVHSSVVALLDNKGFLKTEEPKVRVRAIDELGVEYKVKYWIDPSQIGPGKSRDLVLESIINNLQKSGISPAYPKADSYYAPMPPKTIDYRSQEGRLALLGKIDALEQLETEYLEMIAAQMHLRYFNADETLFNEGDPGESMFIVVVGLLKVSITRDGNDLIIAQITPGQFFGEMSMLTGEPRSATIRTATDVIAYEIYREHLNEVFDKQPKSIDIISTVIAQRQISNDKLNERLSEKEMGQKVESLAKQLWNRIVSFQGL